MKNTPIYQCVTTAADIEKYVHGYSVVVFDFETAPNEPYRKEDKAALPLPLQRLILSAVPFP